MPRTPARTFLAHGGAMGALMRAHDWSASPLGPPETWPMPLRTIVGVMLAANQPMFAAWGPERAMLYNDAYAELLGHKHPAAIGRPFFEAWHELTESVGPIMDRAYAGEPTAMDDLELTMVRHGYPEETHFSFFYAPLRDGDGSVGGVYCACTEITERVLQDRRNALLYALGERLADLGEADGIMREAARLLGEHLGAARAGFADLSSDTARNAGEWMAAGTAPTLGRHDLHRFGHGFRADLAAGRTVAVPDIARDPRTVPGADAFAALGIGALVAAPVIRAGRTVAALYVHAAMPRGWSVGDVDLAEAVAQRAWVAVERARAEAALRASEEFNRRVLGASADCIKVLSLDARLESMSEGGMCVMEVDDFGAIEGASWPDFWPPGERAKALAAIEEAMHGGTARFQGFATTMKGTPRWWDVIVSPIAGPDGRPERLLSVSRDVTATREAEERLRGMNATLERLVAERTAERDRVWRLSQDLLLVARGDGAMAAVNPAWTEVLGWTEAELVGRPIFDLIHPEDLASTVEAARAIAEAGRTVPRFENRYRRRDGTHRWIAWTAGPSEGAIVAVGRDVTEEKARAAQLAQAEEALRQAQKMEAVGQLTGGLAHDVNNMLQGIGGALQMMERRIAEGRLADLPRLLRAGREGVDRAAALTHGLLAFARRGRLEPTPLLVDEVVGGIADLLRRTVGPGIEVRLRLDDGTGTARLDRSGLESALLNLAINARDAMPEGGTLSLATGDVRLSAEDLAGDAEVAPGDFVLVAVSDTGTGMPPGVLARVFEPFFTTKPIGKGTGLGLSQVYGFVRQSGGVVRVESEVGRGTTVRLLFPAHAAAEVPSEEVAPSPPPAADGSGATVLLVEDEPAVRALTAEALRDRGWRVLEAEDGPAGLRRLSGAGRVDLLVTDVGLPGLNGRQLADAARERRPALPVLFVTGYAGTALDDALPPGTAAITKPFSLDALVAQAATLLTGTRSGAEEGAGPTPSSAGPTA